ncbi:MAG: RnfABCDGE type electron transport complex subunit G [Pseudomonadota bacterium]
MSDKGVSVMGGTLRLTLIAGIAAAIVGLAWEVTRDPIAANQHERRMAEFSAVLGGIRFDTLDYDTPKRFDPPHSLPGDEVAEIYHAMLGARLAAAVFVLSADGYNGPIKLMIGMTPERKVIAVRVLSHNETPGLADDIERERSEWITSFDQRSVNGTNDPDWALQQNGGVFEGFTGASITPRAIVLAVRDTLIWAERFPDRWQAPGS